ncbi:UDP-N-acetylglucosamine transporter [Hypsibius exemplaris]|uniref:UDP-N-acetylglucosamine transporter n=1 Tax=Hypsibius exemplaris TaxID=2072580 RepID=A0A1W0WIQ4_HYPEX|nr:UDP-N-acetylglucosamine transporter [Hypsibius exemplaris]
MSRINMDGPEGNAPPRPAAATTSKAMKYTSLITLVLQTTSIILFLRVSRTSVGMKYLSSTAVTMTEVLKVVICLAVMLAQNGGSVRAVTHTIDTEILQKRGETLKLLIPAVLYTIQNNLLFLALSHLDAATYQVTYQLKILTTAVFSVTMLSKRIAAHQWIALVILTVGVALVQMPTGIEATTKKNSEGSTLIGLTAVILACFSSGFSGVYFEKILKSSKTSLWVRNLQLGFFSVLIALGGVVVTDLNAVLENGFFQGYNWLTVTVIFFHGFGGIIVALTIRYADNILKCFAGAVSIILSCVISYLFLGDFVPSLIFVLGTTMVIIATFLYGYEKPAVSPLLAKSRSDNVLTS